MASPVDPHALNERLLALFNHTNSNSDASISRSRRSLVSDSSLSSTEVDPDTFFHRSLFDIGDGEPLGELGPMNDMEPVADNHLEEWTKSMADYWVQKRENDRRAALAKVEEERSNAQPFTGNLFEPQTPPSNPLPDSQIHGEKGLEFEAGGIEIVQDSASPARFTEECYEKVPIACMEDIGGTASGKQVRSRRVRSKRQSSNHHGNSSQTSSRRQPQTRATRKTTRSKSALSQATNTVLNGRIQKPRQSSSSASPKSKPASTTSPLRRSARIQAMKEKAQMSKPTASSPSRGQSKSTKQPQKRQPFRNSKAHSKPQGISKPRTRSTRRIRNSNG